MGGLVHGGMKVNAISRAGTPRAPHESRFRACHKPEPDAASHGSPVSRHHKKTKPFVWVSYKASFLGLYNYCKSARGTWLRARNVMHGYSNYDQLRGKHIRNSDPSRFIGPGHPALHGGPGKEIRHSKETHRGHHCGEASPKSHLSDGHPHGKAKTKSNAPHAMASEARAIAESPGAQASAVQASRPPSVQVNTASSAAATVSGSCDAPVSVNRAHFSHGGSIKSSTPAQSPITGAPAATLQDSSACLQGDAPAQSAPSSVLSNLAATSVQVAVSLAADTPGRAVQNQSSGRDAEQPALARTASHAGRLSAIHGAVRMRPHRLHFAEMFTKSEIRSGDAPDGREAKAAGNSKVHRTGRGPRGRAPSSVIYMASHGPHGKRLIHPKVVSSADAFPQ